MNTYQLISGNCGIGLMVKDCIHPELVEKLALEHYEELIKTKGRMWLLHERFISIFNEKFVGDSAAYCPQITTCQHTIIL